MSDTSATRTMTQNPDESVVAFKLRQALARRAAAAGDNAVAPPPAMPVSKDLVEAKQPKAKKAIIPAEFTEKLEAAKLEAKAAADKVRQEKQAAILKDREVRKAEKEAAKAAKVAKPANLSKVEKAAAKLPKLSTDASTAYDTCVSALDKGQIAALALHLQHFLRAEATKASSGVKLAVGDIVTVINSADPRIIGLEAEVSQVHRIRVHVTVPGFKGEFYLFNADVTAWQEPEAASTDDVSAKETSTEA